MDSGGYAMAAARHRGLPALVEKEWARRIQHIVADGDTPLRILDLGCGWGRFTKILAAINGRPVSVVALDADPAMVLLTEKMVRSADLSNVAVQCADFLRWDNQAKFDLVFVSEVLQLVSNRTAFFERICDLLTADGHLVMRLPTRDQLACIEWLGAFPRALDLDRRRTPSQDEIVAMIRESGLVVDRCDLVDESITVTGAEYRSAITSRGYSILHTLSVEEVDEGLLLLDQQIAGREVIDLDRRTTLITATREWEPTMSIGERNVLSVDLNNLPVEQAHGGAGSRQMIFARGGGVSPHLEAVTKGFLPSGAAFDWHDHDVDEFFIVLNGSGTVQHGEEPDVVTEAYVPGQVFYCPASTRHKITCEGPEEAQYLFVRLDS